MPPAAVAHFSTVEGFYIVLTEPHSDMEDCYHRWYNEQHLPDILAVPGVEFARRYVLSPVSHKVARPNNFAAFYGLSDVKTAVDEILARRGTERLRPSASVDRAKNRSCIFEGHRTDMALLCQRDGFHFGLFSSGVPSNQPPGNIEVIKAVASSIQATAASISFNAIQLQPFQSIAKSPDSWLLDRNVEAYEALAISDFFQ